MKMKMRRKSFRGVALALTLVLAACQKPATPTPATSRRLLIPAHGIYAGAYIEAGDKEDDVTLEKIEEFEQLVGKHQAIVASSSATGANRLFPTRMSASSRGTARFR